jgi:flagellar basal-body rod modification protein FlgD
MGNIIGSQDSAGAFRMVGDELKASQNYVKSFNSALRAENKGTNQELGKDDFLKLLVTQLRYQDPMQPMQDKEFISQMAQFSSLEQTKNMADEFGKFNQTMSLTQERNNTLNFLGKMVEILGDDGQVKTGIVDSVNLRDGLLKVDGQYHAVDSILSVSVVNNINIMSSKDGQQEEGGQPL